MDESDNTNETVIARQPKRGGKVWLISLIVLCALIIGYGALYSDNTVTNIPELIGRYLVYSIFVFAVYLPLFARKRSNKVQGAAYLAIFTAMMVGGLVSGNKNTSADISAVKELQDDYNRLVNEGFDQDGLPLQVAPKEMAPFEAGTDIERLTYFAQETLNELIVLRNSYLSSIDEAGINGLLDAERLRKDQNLQESRIIIDRVTKNLTSYQDNLQNRILIIKREAWELELSSPDRNELIEAFIEGVDKGQEERDELLMLEWKALHLIEDIIDILAASPDWSVENGELVFSQDQDVESYQRQVPRASICHSTPASDCERVTKTSKCRIE